MKISKTALSKNTNYKGQHLPEQKIVFGFSYFGNWKFIDIWNFNIYKIPSKQIPSGDNQVMIL